MAEHGKQARASDIEGLLPQVAGAAPGNWGMWSFFAILAAGGFWLFSAMNANRIAAEAPAVTAPQSPTGARIAAGPPLPVPDRLLGIAQPGRYLAPAPQAATPPARAIPAPIVPPARTPAAAPPMPRPADFPRGPSEPADGTPRPSVVFDNAFGGGNTSNVTPAPPSQNRVTAGRFSNPSRTIPQGTVIPAVLETALDSTRPGAARALVQRDIYGFDGTRILVHRGSRLYGEYESGLEAGQNRALIQWTRLIRPDGVTIALDSPSSDPLGRAGIKGDVDGKFLQRFGGAILQSVLDIGVGVATRRVAGDGVILALPGSTQNVQVTDQQRVQRTLKIRHGTSVSVFVARDLDFSTVEF